MLRTVDGRLLSVPPSGRAGVLSRAAGGHPPQSLPHSLCPTPGTCHGGQGPTCTLRSRHQSCPRGSSQVGTLGLCSWQSRYPPVAVGPVGPSGTPLCCDLAGGLPRRRLPTRRHDLSSARLEPSWSAGHVHWPEWKGLSLEHHCRQHGSQHRLFPRCSGRLCPFRWPLAAPSESRAGPRTPK